jgi:hypothetical protein
MICSCVPTELITIPEGLCLGQIRQTTPSRWAFYNCDTELPTTNDPAVMGAAIKAIYDAGGLMITPELTLFNFADPTYDEIQVSDCNTPLQIVATREITYEDRNKIDTSTISPFTGSKYFDYVLSQFIVDNQANLKPILIYCNGDAKIINKKFTIRGILNYLRSGQAGGPSTEIKQWRINFQGDPIDFNTLVSFNLIDSDIPMP